MTTKYNPTIKDINRGIDEICDEILRVAQIAGSRKQLIKLHKKLIKLRFQRVEKRSIKS
jgi:Mg2+ and Co2+ transporter CorA